MRFSLIRIERIENWLFKINYCKRKSKILLKYILDSTLDFAQCISKILEKDLSLSKIFENFDNLIKNFSWPKKFNKQ